MICVNNMVTVAIIVHFIVPVMTVLIRFWLCVDFLLNS